MGVMIMWSADEVITTVKWMQKKYNMKGELDVELFCREFGVDVNGVVYLLARLFAVMFKGIREADNELRKLREENKRLCRLVNNMCHDNGRIVQMAKVMSGEPIARKKTKNLMELSLQIKLGLTDEELMENFKISKTTLWRWKKELEEKKKSDGGLYF